MAYDKVLQTLQETSRRKILMRLQTGPKSVAEITARMAVARFDRSGPALSRFAVSQPLKVLVEAEVVSYNSHFKT